MYRISTRIRCTGNSCAYKIILLMKLTTVFLIATILQVSASTFAQKVTLSGRSIPLSTVLRQIRIQTGYNLLWNENDLDPGQNIDVSFENAALDQVLKSCLAGSGLTYEIKDKTILITRGRSRIIKSIVDYLESINVSGIVVNEKGAPMPGTTVKVKGIDKSTLTDSNGKFTLNNVDQDALLLFSFLGYRKIEIAAGKVNSKVIMTPEITSLDEVKVTTAYGIERNKRELGYSVAKVSGDDLTKANSGSLLMGLTGKVSGLNIMSESSSMSPQMHILIRGIRSFGESSNNQPLFIFNGSPLSFGSDGDSGQQAVDFINNLNPADIEDVTVLKGANGTALYGPEGVNGVIVITTKKVKIGVVAVNVKTNQSFNRIDWRYQDEQKQYGKGNATSIFGGQDISSWGPAYNGQLVPIGYPDANGKYQMVPYSYNNDRHKFFNVASTNRTNVSLANGGANSNLYLGIGHLDQTGLLPGDKQNQTSVLYNASNKVGQALDLGLTINFAQTNSDRGADVTQDILETPSFIPLLNYKDYRNSYWGSADNYWNGINPYAKLASARQKQTDNVFNGNMFANVKILPWLSVKDQLGAIYNSRRQKTNAEPFTFSDYARVDPAKRSDTDPTTADYVGTALTLNNDFIISALTQTDDFVFRGSVGNSIRDIYSKILKTNASLVIPIYNDIYARSDYGIGADETTMQQRNISAFGTASMGYKDRFFLELTARNEWDSKEAKVARGKDFYFGGNSSIVLKEVVPFLKKQDWLSAFRLRVSLVRTANLNIEPQQSERRFYVVFPYPYTSSTGVSTLAYGVQTNPNPNIKPEKIWSQEYGVEIGILKNRVRFDATYYTQVNDGVILKVRVPPYSGFPDYDNAGKIRNKGLEFDLTLDPLVDFSGGPRISLSGRLSYNNNKVLKVSDVYNGVFIAQDPSTGLIYYAKEGETAFQYGVYDFKRSPGGSVIVDKVSGIPTYDYLNPQIKGKTLPVYQGGLTLNVAYKHFTLSTQADYSAGNDHQFSSRSILNGTSSFTLLTNRQPFIYPNSVIEDIPGHYIKNTEIAMSDAGQNFFSQASYANINSIRSASFWKIREVALQYDAAPNKKFIKSMTAGLYVRDLFAFYPKSNIFGDPVGSYGPGLNNGFIQSLGQRTQSQTNNLVGGSSTPNTLPGTFMYGFTLGLTF